MTINTTNINRFVRRPEVSHLTGLSRSQIYKLAKDGEFPLPIQLSARTVAWSLSDVTRWMDDRVARTNSSRRCH